MTASLFDHLPRHCRPAHTLVPAAARHLRTLGNLIATNGEVRKILFDFSVIGRDILATAATQVAQHVRPTHDALADVNRPGPSDQFESAKGKTVGVEETPVAEFDAPATSTTVRHDPHKGLEIEHEGQVLDASQTADEARNRTREVASEAKATAEYVYIRNDCFFSITEVLV